MIRRSGRRLVLTAMEILLAFGPTYGQGTGTVSGRVTDRADGTPLWGANVIVTGTPMGATTDDAGKFRILQLPAGKVSIAVRYLGYETAERDLTVEAGQVVQVEISLRATVIPQDEVVVTAQLKGQQAAINQQLNSNSIVNVVSQERIRELPDQNAAEAISRLPGISVQRDGGEGQKVLMRGLSAKYTNVTVNGEKIPSMDEVDRSVDLSSVSADMLAGIEVYKSYTADQDGDAVGGTINFAMKKAPEALTTDIKVQGGYNGLQDRYNDHKISVSVANRFFDNALGVVVTGNHQGVNRSSQGLDADYNRYFQVGQAILTDVQDVRYRYGASLATDARLEPIGDLFLTGFWSKLEHNPLKGTKEFNQSTNQGVYRFSDGATGTELLVLGLSANHLIDVPVVGALDLNWRVSGSRSSQSTPLLLKARFYEKSVQNVVTTQGPDAVFQTWIPRDNKAYLDQLRYDSLDVLDKNLTFQLNAKFDFNVGNALAGFMKFGGKYNSKTRDRNTSEMFSGTFLYTSNVRRNYQYIDTTAFPVSVDKFIGTKGFLSGTEATGTFLEGRFGTWSLFSPEALHRFFDAYRNFVSPIAGGALFLPNPAVSEDTYNAGEKIWAVYAMTELNFGDVVMVLPGVRYERTLNDFRTVYGQITTTPDEVPTLVSARDTSGVTEHGDWLPTIQVRVRPLDWLAVRASASRTIARPDFADLVPYEKFDRDADPGSTISLGNPSLRRSSSMNFDLFVSASNPYGFVSAGGFYKEITDVPYSRMLRILDPNNDYVGWYIAQTVNADGISWVRGAEIELQANLSLLPNPFDGIVINGNVSFMNSRTVTPSLLAGKTPTGFDTVYTVLRSGPMPGQADRIANLTVGYEKGPFSGRVSFVLQGRLRSFVGNIAEQDGYSDTYYRWDLAVQQKIISGLHLYFNMYNLTNVRDKSFLGSLDFPTSELMYGRTAELGVRYKF